MRLLRQANRRQAATVLDLPGDGEAWPVFRFAPGPTVAPRTGRMPGDSSAERHGEIGGRPHAERGGGRR